MAANPQQDGSPAPRLPGRRPGAWRPWVGKLGLVLLLCLVSIWNGEVDRIQFHNAWVKWPEKQDPSFSSQFTAYDSAHYLWLSKHGYQRGHYSCAFYPLWPALIKLGGTLLGGESFWGSHLFAGLILSNLFSAAALFLLWKIILHRQLHETGPTHPSRAIDSGPHTPESVAGWTLALFITYPGSLFYQLPYSESLFLLLLLGVIRGLQLNRWGWVGLCCFLLPLTRGPGLFCFLPLAWRWWRKRDVPLSACWLVVMGSTAYFAIMWFCTGNAFEGLAAQRFWGAHSILNLINVPAFIWDFFSPTCWHGFRGSILDRLFLVSALSLLPFLWQREREWFWWAICLAVLPALSGHCTSMIRFGAIAFPLFYAGALYLLQFRFALIRWLVIALFLALHVILLRRQLSYQWAS